MALPRPSPRVLARRPQHGDLLDALMGYVASLLHHGGRRRPSSSTWPSASARACRALPLRHAQCRAFHNYFVTHLPSSSLHPDARLPRPTPGDIHQLSPAASVPLAPGPPAQTAVATPSTAGPLGSRDLTVVRIPLRSAKHHFGAHNARGQRPYNEDTNQAGTIAMPAFAKRAPMSLQRGRPGGGGGEGAEDGITAGPVGDPQIFYFGVFDGHGGDECSVFLRDELHGYIEEAAAEFGLRSSLAPANSDRPEETADADARARHAESLQKELLEEYRDTVGGYFRRFRPEGFPALERKRRRLGGAAASAEGRPADTAAPLAKPPVPPTLETTLTYAFLRADLDFVAAQARKPDPDDPYVGDFPLNEDEVLGAPHYRHRHGAGIDSGGHVTAVARSKVRFRGGSTASIALISTPTPAPFWHPAARSSLLVAHVGDTRVLLCDTATGQARPLTRDHHPSSPVEARRLTRYVVPDSFVSSDSFGEQRIFSGLANSRAFGDMGAKRLGVSAEPDMTRVDLGPAQYAFMVLVSDGVSGTLGDQEIVDVVKEARTPDQGARDVVDYATEVSRDGDNATCLVVRLGGWERRHEGGHGSLGTKELRDARRAEALDPRRGRQ